MPRSGLYFYFYFSGPGARNRAHYGQNYYTHGHPRGGVCGGTVELRDRSCMRRGELEIGTNFGPLAAPWRSSLAPWEPFL